MTKKAPEGIRSIADEPISLAEARPAPASARLSTAQAEDDHPALDRNPRARATETQNARHMNEPADRVGVPFTGEQLTVADPIAPAAPASSFTGAGLMTTSAEAAQRVAPALGSDEPREH